MSLNAVKHYVAAQAPSVSLQGLIWTTMKGFAQRPKPDKAGSNCFLVVGRVRRPERRLTPPRGLAIKENTYRLDVLVYATHSDEQEGGDHFDALLENVAAVYRGATPGNPTLADAFGQPTSYITHIGENIDLELLDPAVTGSSKDSRVAFRGILTLEIREVLSPA